ncbi:MAG TPA: hypothetical protein VL978_14220 [Puia sp.]|nr:hypothetical protein [Puia sp.]
MNKLIQNAKTPGWWSEPKNIAAAIVGLAFLAGLSYGFLTYVLPWLIKVTWNLVNLVIAGVVCGFLLMTITNRKSWRALKYFSEFVANYSIGLAIELNPFNILQAKIDQGYKDRETLYRQSGRLKGKQSELMDKLAGKEKEMQLNIQKVKILQAGNGGGGGVGRAAATGGVGGASGAGGAGGASGAGAASAAGVSGAGASGVGASRQINLCTNNVMRCREYIENVTPIVSDLNKLILFADAAYEESGVMLEDARLDLEAKKDLYYSVTTGLSAMTSAMRAFKGDDELNRDAEKALALLKVRIGEKIGHIKSAIAVTSRFMDDQVLEDKAKSAQALELINRFDLGKDFHYSGVAGDGNKGRLNDVSVDKYKKLLD